MSLQFSVKIIKYVLSEFNLTLLNPHGYQQKKFGFEDSVIIVPMIIEANDIYYVAALNSFMPTSFLEMFLKLLRTISCRNIEPLMPSEDNVGQTVSTACFLNSELWQSNTGRMPDSQSRESGVEPPLLPFRSLGIFILSTTPPGSSFNPINEYLGMDGDGNMSE